MTVDVAIVGGGPAGAALAIGLARRGREVVVLERSSAWRWRACGVFTSPMTVRALARLGLTEADLASVARPLPAMRVETPAGTRFRLTYGDDGSASRRAAAVGLDRSALDPLLLERARAAGVDIHEGAAVRRVEGSRLVLGSGGRDELLDARVVIGADGIRSTVARSFGVARSPRLGARVGLTLQVADPGPSVTRDARMILFRDGYVGLAPVPGGRVNVGIVLGRSWAAGLRRDGAERTVETVLAARDHRRRPPPRRRHRRSCRVRPGHVLAVPLEGRRESPRPGVSRAAGPVRVRRSTTRLARRSP